MPQLRAGDLVLEPLEVRHASEMFPIVRDPELYRFIDHPPPPTLEHLRKLYTRLEGRRSPDDTDHWLNWIVRHGSEAVGVVQATVDPRHEAWVAFMFDRRHQGRGFACRSTLAMMECLTRDYSVERFLATVEAGNARSVRLLERLGFTLAAADEPTELAATERLYVRR
jgi:RimJ/RimL family protein N-acetyltransferase